MSWNGARLTCAAKKNEMPGMRRLFPRGRAIFGFLAVAFFHSPGSEKVERPFSVHSVSGQEIRTFFTMPERS